MLETYYALKSPVMEAEHAIDEATALSLYDCLITKIKEQRRFKVLPDSKFSISDFMVQQRLLQAEYELEKKKLPRAYEEIAELKVKCE